jgi:hypothetical protein
LLSLFAEVVDSVDVFVSAGWLEVSLAFGRSPGLLEFLRA